MIVEATKRKPLALLLLHEAREVFSSKETHRSDIAVQESRPSPMTMSLCCDNCFENDGRQALLVNFHINQAL